MTDPQSSSSPPLYHGPFGGAQPLGIDRANYIAIHSSDPAAAARFATEHMGFHLVHVDAAGRHYLAGHGLDPYSLVYTPGEQGAVDHISYLLRSATLLSEAEACLSAAGVASERVQGSALWRHGPALRFKNPSGQIIELTAGVQVDVPMAALVAEPQVTPAPITLDHAVVRAVRCSGRLRVCRANHGTQGIPLASLRRTEFPFLVSSAATPCFIAMRSRARNTTAFTTCSSP